MHDYKTSLIQDKLKNAGIQSGDTVYCHSNLGFFGRPDKNIKSINLAKIFFDALDEVLGNNGTIILPSYTYSFGSNSINRQKNNSCIFDVKNTASKMGILSEYARMLPDTIRTIDPFFSSIVYGNLKKYFTAEIPNNSFDSDSLFGRLFKINGKILNLNSPGGTFIHFLERELSVKYRYDKIFEGEIILDNKKKMINWTIFARDLSIKLNNFNPFHITKYIKQNKIAKYVEMGRGEILTITTHDLYNAVKKKLLNNEWYLTDRFDKNNYK